MLYFKYFCLGGEGETLIDIEHIIFDWITDEAEIRRVLPSLIDANSAT